MRSVSGNIRYALRQFRMAPVFTAAAVLTLALGIGGTTAIFTLIHAVMLRSLPVGDPGQLYRVGEGDDCCVEGGPQDRWGMFSYPLYERLKAETPEFEETTAFQAGNWQTSVRREKELAARPLRSEYVTGTYFSVLGVGAFGGRVFTPEDDKPGAPPVAVLSHRVWQTAYGGDTSMVGSTLFVEGHPFTVIGVAPPGFFGETVRANPPEIWLPLQQEPMVKGEASLLHQSVSAWLRMIGRLKPGATTEGMSARLTGVLRQWMQNDSGYPSNWMPDVIRMLPRQVLNVVPAGAGVAVMKEQYGRSLQILLAVCGLVLLIACANVANLLLARGVARRGQTAVRLALGASRRQIIGQALTESVLLAIGGGMIGLVVAVSAARLLLSLAFHSAKFLPISVMPSTLVLGFSFGLALLTGIIFGAAPAWFATHTHPADALRGTGRGTSDKSSFTRKALLVAQATISVVLVAGATMLGRSLNRLETQDFGYQVPGRVEVSILSPQVSSYTLPRLNALYRQMEERLSRLPGVEQAGLALYNPMTDNWGELILVQGHPAPKMEEDSGASWDRVSTHYLEDLGMPILRGRGFTEADNETTAPVAVVNEGFVKRFFKNGEDPIDKHFGLDLPELSGTYRIIGVVRDAKFAGWGLDKAARPMFYVPLTQSVSYTNELMTKLELRSHFISGILLVSKVPTGTLEPLVRQTLADLDPNLTITDIRTLREQIDLAFDQERAVASLAGLFGVVALVLAAIGLYGVTAYSVAQRTNEIGIRMALGANRGRVMELVLRGAFRRVLIGLLLGLPLAIGAGRLISAQLYGVKSWDPLALGTAAGALAICSFIAALIPANRAASISPMSALRIE
ncbi:MAG TPA: ABC transporter permease [Candidatus Acidoferrales bacterium]|nr:ABC transporter permease [Candidatus Acidoferrales bacterium]